MAQSARINGIINDLVASFAKISANENVKKLKQAKELASRSAKAQQHVRTNQFEVEGTLNGLIEKFSIINRDDLAGALNKRLIELQTRSTSKWTPEVLSLFLHLADRPDQKSNLEALELLKPPSPPPSPVTWDQLDAEEPLKGDVWLDESYSSASEDELEENTELETKSRSRLATTTFEDEIDNSSITKPVSTRPFTDLKLAQFWTQADLRSSKPQLLTELQIIREVLLMLHSLPTSIFAIDEKNILVYHATNVALSQISLSSLNDVLQSFASIGSDVLRLRTWAQRSPTVPLLQAFNSAVSQRLRDFDRQISMIEQRFVPDSGRTVVVSILQVHQDIETLSRSMSALNTITMAIPTTSRDFMCLELLYDQICASQAAGDEECFTVLGQIFFECLNIYLRPVSLWMEQGTILENDETFFIAVSDKSSALSALWHERYTLRMTSNGTLHAPKFLLPAAKKILNAGKSIVFLQHLRKETPAHAHLQRIGIKFEDLVDPDDGVPLLPFSELFSTAFANWMQSNYGPASSILKRHLLEKCNLLQHVDTLEHIYFSKDGTVFQTFADEVFKRMQRRKAWNDKYILTELARRTFGAVEGLKAGSLSVRTMATARVESRSVKPLMSIFVDVNLPWTVQNIVQRSSMGAYQSILQLLLQVYYAEHLLRSTGFSFRAANASIHRLAIGVRQQLIWFANVIHSYVLETVVQISIKKLRDQLAAAEDVDAMCKLHEEFMAKLETSCLLVKNLAPIYDSVIAMLDLAAIFARIDAPPDKSLAESKAQSRATSSMRRARRKQRAKDEGQVDDESDSGNESEADEAGEHEDVAEGSDEDGGKPIEERLQFIHEKFAQLLHFTVAGLRGVSRAGGQVEWEMLAEKLEWGLQRRRRVLDYI